jgi:hypothetical protein
MSHAHETLATEGVRLGPIQTIEVRLAAPPEGRHIVESLGNDTVPFEQIRHLIARRPLSAPVRPQRS